MAAFALKRPPRKHTLISVISLIDVLMILLFFFMITSTYLNLDMVPALQKSDEAPEDGTPPPETPQGLDAPSTLLIRIGADGMASVRGQTLDPAALATLLQDRLAADPLTPVVLFPSGSAQLQALVTVMDIVTRAGAVRVKVIRLGAAK